MQSQHPFHFLSACFSYPEDKTFLDNQTTLSLLAHDFNLPLTEEIDADLNIHDLQAEYVRLFINGPGGVAAPPYASIYVNNAGLLRQKGYDDALAMYRLAGLEPAESDESPDHIVHELAFLGLLFDRNDVALAGTFLKDHLCQWYPRFYGRLSSADPQPFYEILARVTDLCLKQTLKEVLDEQTTFS